MSVEQGADSYRQNLHINKYLKISSPKTKRTGLRQLSYRTEGGTRTRTSCDTRP